MQFFKVLAAAACAACGIGVAQTLPPSPSVQLAVDPVRNKVYSANRNANAVFALDATTGITTQIPVGNGPDFVAVDPTRDRVYVNNARDASLTVITGTSNTASAPYAIGTMGPLAINADPTGAHNVVFNVRMTSAASDEVTYFYPNGAGNPTWYTIATDSFQPNALAVNPATHTIYVTHYATGDVRIIDGTFNGIDFPHPPSLGMWSHPFAVAANPVTGKAYVITEDSRGPIAVINSTTSAVFPAVTVGHAVAPRSILVNPLSNKVYAAFRNEVIVIDGATNALTYIPITGAGSGGIALGLNIATNRIYAATELGTLNVIDGDSNTVESTAPIAAGTSSIGVNPVTNTIYLYAGGSVTALAGAAGTAHTVPITTTITPLPGNNTSPSGSITLNASTAWAGLPVRKVYYRIDSTNGEWSEAALAGSAYTAAFSGLANGSHTLYAFAVDDQVAPLNTSPGSSPVVGAIASYTFTVNGSLSTPSVSLVSSANPSNPGQAVTFTASVTGSSGTPTGTITFLDGTNAICSNVAIASGSATCATAALTAGAHSITARYSGNSAYASASSATVTQTVKAVPAVALTSSANPSTSGQSVTFTATVSGSLGAPGGTVTFLDGTTTLCAAVALASGAATCSTSTLTNGAHSITAQYSGDANYATVTSAALTQNVRMTPTVGLDTSVNPSNSGQPVTFTANVAGTAGTPSGTVTFLDGSIAICSAVALASANASCSTSSLSPGSHSITAQYSGDNNYTPATSIVITQNVTGNATVTLASSINPSSAGQSVTFTASVTGGLGQPTGTVTFLDGATAICTGVALASGSAACTTTGLSVGVHTLTARYSGNSTYATATSSALTQTVKAAPSVALTSSANPSVTGQSVTFTASVTGGAGTATGTVTFLDGATAVCTSVALASGNASCTTSTLSAGPHSITAQYGGDGNYASATSAVLTQNVTGNVTVTLTSSVNPSNVAQNVTFSATVSGALGQPTGTITFLDGSATICANVALASGAAACSTAALAAGTHAVTARYSGNSSYSPATSAAVTQVVKATATVALGSSANPSTSGQSVTFTANVTGSAGTPTGTVTFLDGSTALCTSVALASGAAACTTSTLSAGPHSITAQYSGDASYAAASSAFSQTVNGNATATLTSSANPSTAGQSVTFTVSISGALGQATGTVAFLDGGAAICSNVPLSAGMASCTTGALSTGAHTITASYPGSSTYAATTSNAVAQTVKATANVTIASSRNPSDAGQAVTFTASVNGAAGMATGTVAFLDGGTTIAGCGSVAVGAGAATCTTSALAEGTHSISARYSGDGIYNGATSSALGQNVNGVKVAPTVALSSSANPSTAGSLVTFVASITGSSGAPAGSVTFLDGGSAIGGCAGVALANGAASCGTTALATGSHSITAQYSGDIRYTPGTSPALRQDVVAPKTTPTVALTASPASPIEGQVVTLGATVSGNGPVATGSITFFDSSTAICTAVALANGTAGCSTSALAIGDHAIHAEYSGDASYNPGISRSSIVTVASRPPATTDVTLAVQADRQTATVGKDVIFRITTGNAGPETAFPVTASATLPAQAQYVWSSAACVFDGSRVACDAGHLAAGQSVAFTLVLRPLAAGSLAVTVSASAPQTDATPANNAQSLTLPVVTAPAAKAVARYRLYNPISLEHLYTTDLNEYNVLGSGGVWVQEGPVGKVLDNPGAFNGVAATPYYRLYNSATLWHHWTTDPNEYYTLLTFPGWGGEGVDGYLLPQSAPGTTQLYRLVYPNGTGLHHWTIDANEYTTLINTYGWVGEGGTGFVLQ